MKTSIKRAIKLLNRFVARVFFDLTGGQKGLIVLTFHTIFKDRAELQNHTINPNQSITVEYFRKIIEYLRRHEFQFISPSDLAEESSIQGNSVLITFDDGYYNNQRILPILEKFKIPALFFITPQNIRGECCYWWDVLYRELYNKDQVDAYKKRADRLKTNKASAIYEQLKQEFGPKSLEPNSPLDRPFTVNELKDFSSHDRVYIGNHTFNHSCLTQLGEEEIRKSIISANELLKKWVGYSPNTIAYPFGNYNTEVLKICDELEFTFGFTVDFEINNRVIDSNLEIDRFLVEGTKSIDKQMKAIRSRISLI